MFKIIGGSVFDSKCDLIIIPCDEKGQVIDPLYKKGVIWNEYTILNQPVKEGEVLYFQNNGIFTYATMIGYARTIDKDSEESFKEELKSILKSVKQCCKNNSFQKINMPFFDSTSSKISEKDIYKIMKEEFENESTLLCVYSNPSIIESLAKNDAKSEDEKEWAKKKVKRLGGK